MFTYHRTAQYYETDQMGIIHHSNYIKWMEEARIAFLDSIGLSYFEMEQMGVASPVTEVNVSYKKPFYFNDRIVIDVVVNQYNGITFEITYLMKNEITGEICTQATSKHAFLSMQKIVSLKKAFPTLHQKLEEAFQQNDND